MLLSFNYTEAITALRLEGAAGENVFFDLREGVSHVNTGDT